MQCNPWVSAEKVNIKYGCTRMVFLARRLPLVAETLIYMVYYSVCTTPSIFLLPNSRCHLEKKRICLYFTLSLRETDYWDAIRIEYM